MDPSTFRGSMLGMVWCSVPSQEVFGSIGLYIYIHILLLLLLLIIIMIIIITIIIVTIIIIFCHYYYILYYILNIIL